MWYVSYLSQCNIFPLELNEALVLILNMKSREGSVFGC